MFVGNPSLFNDGKWVAIYVFILFVCMQNKTVFAIRTSIIIYYSSDELPIFLIFEVFLNSVRSVSFYKPIIVFNNGRLILKGRFCKKKKTDFTQFFSNFSRTFVVTNWFVFCCFVRAALARRPNGAKQQKQIHFSKQMYAQNYWRTTGIFRYSLLIWDWRYACIMHQGILKSIA